MDSILDEHTSYHGSDCDSDNSFKSDSSFEYSDDDEDEQKVQYESGRSAGIISNSGKNEKPKKHWTRLYGKKFADLSDKFSKLSLIQKLVRWYKNRYAGSILVVIAISQLMLIPYLDYAIQTDSAK